MSVQQIYKETKKEGIFYSHHRISLAIGLISLTEFTNFIDYSNIIVIIINKWLLDSRTMLIFLTIKITTMYIYVFSSSIEMNETATYNFKDEKFVKPALYRMYIFLCTLTVISCQLPTILRIIYMKQTFSYIILISNVISLFFTSLIINKKLCSVYYHIHDDIISNSEQIYKSIKRLKFFQLFFSIVSISTIIYCVILITDLLKNGENITDNIGKNYNFVKIPMFIGVYISLWFNYIPCRRNKKNTFTLTPTNSSPKLSPILVNIQPT